MISLFFIHSHTCFLSAIGTINLLNLPSEDVRFIYARDYKNTIVKHNYHCCDISTLYRSFQEDHLRRIWHDSLFRKDCIKKMDVIIHKLVGHNKFEVYIPHLAFSLFRVVVTHPDCIRYSFIQEGGVPFSTSFKNRHGIGLSIYFWFYNHFCASKRLKMGGNWLYPAVMDDSVVIDTYATSDSFFANMPQHHNHIIQWPKIKVNFEIVPNSVVFVFDGFVNNNHIEKEYYLSQCERLVNDVAASLNYIKFHPAQDEEQKNQIIKYFSDRKKDVKILSNEIPFELILSSSSRMKVAGFGSSLLFFAKDFGHDVICRDEWLNNSPKYKVYKQTTGFMWFKETYKE